MKILVFDRDENLKGPLKNILLAVHTEEIHGDNILNIRTTDYLEKGYRLAYKDKYGFWHEFIVKGLQETHAVTEPVIDAYCEASFYELLGDYIEDKRPQGVPANTALARALEGTRWEVGFVDDLGSNTTNFYHISAMEAVYKVAEVWGGEIKPRIVVAGNKITHRYIDLLTRRGADRGKRFEFGKDISGIARYVQDDDIKTALYGYGMGEILENGEYGRRIDFAELNDGKAYVENLEAKEIWGRLNPDGTKSHVFGKVEFDAIEDPQELLEATIEELEKRSQPQISYEATVTDLKAYGYDHEGIELGDTVAVIDRGFPRELRIKARCIRYARDLIDETNNKITLGNFLPNFIDGELDQQRRLENIMARQGIWDKAKILDPDGLSAQYLKDLVQVLNNELNAQGGYVYLTDDGKGLITYDKPIDQDPTMAIQLLGGAFRIANSKLPNGEFDWRTFGTGEGFVADVIVAGMLQGGKVHFDLTNGTFLIGDSIEDYNFYFDGTTLKVRLGTGKTVEESLQEIKDYADTKVENLEIGGRNYAKGTSKDFTYVSVGTYSGSLTNAGATSQYIYTLEELGAQAGDTMTVSMYVGESEEGFGGGFRIDDQTGSNKYSTYKVVKNGYVSETFTILEGSTEIRLYTTGQSQSGASASYELPVKELKLEKGNKATDWTPAPEDVDEAISTVDTKYSNKVAEIDTTIDSITQRVSSTESDITTINGIVAAHDTRIESAESKITPSAIVDTVRSSTAYTDDLSGKVDTTQFESYRLQTAQLIEDRVEKDGVIAAISLSPETAKIQANKIKLEGLVTANSNFKILADGSIETKNANVSGTITATSGTVGDWSIGSSIYSKHGSTYTILKGSGLVAFATGAHYPNDGVGANLLIYHDGRIRTAGDKFQILADGTMKAQGAEITGTITATGGKIGNWIINYNNTGTLMGRGSDGSVFYIAPPDSSYPYLLNVVDSTGAVKARITKEGVLLARGADIVGSITSSTITGTTVTGGTVRTSSSGDRIQLSDNLLRAYASGTQRVRLDTNALRFYNSNGTSEGYVSAFAGYLAISADHTIWCAQNTQVKGWLRPDMNNTYDLGSANYRWRRIYLQNNPDVISDIRLKSSIQNIPDGLLGELKEIQPKMYQQGEKWHFGYIAQDVERALYKYALKTVGWDKAKDYVREFDVLYKDESYLSLVYAEIAVLKEAEMQARIDELEARLLALEQAS